MKHLLAFSSLAAVLVLTSCDKDDDDDNVNAQDRNFTTEFSLANKSEISLANLALARATDSSVINYAQMMITEHTDAERELRDIADDLDINLSSDSLNAMAAALKPVLEGLSGQSFDSAYIVSQLPAHEAARSLVQGQIDSGANNQLRNYAGKLLPKIQMHHTAADTIAARFR